MSKQKDPVTDLEKPVPNNSWIVTNHKFMRHRTPESAEKEAARLSELTGKKFEVLRVNSTVRSSVEAL